MPPIFHFTDLDNVAPILEANALRCHREAPTRVDVGNQGIKTARQQIEVGCGPGGVVCDYVPFYFAPRSPMLFSIKCGNVPEVSPDQDRLVYFVSSTDVAYAAGLRRVFSNGNAATHNITKFEDDRQKLDSHVDWPVMELTYWHNTDEDPDRRRRRMAEFLIHEAMPLELFAGLAVRTEQTRSAVADLVGGAGIDLPVRRRSDWYF